MAQDNTAGEFLMGFVIGGLVGAAVALILAPQSGSETVAQIREKGIELKGHADNLTGDVRDRASDLASQAKDKASQLTDQARSTVDNIQLPRPGTSSGPSSYPSPSDQLGNSEAAAGGI